MYLVKSGKIETVLILTILIAVNDKKYYVQAVVDDRGV